jgi:hypothetical protein
MEETTSSVESGNCNIYGGEGGTEQDIEVD